MKDERSHYKMDCYKLVGYHPGNPKHGDQRVNNDFRSGFDNKSKQRKIASSAHNVVVEYWQL